MQNFPLIGTVKGKTKQDKYWENSFANTFDISRSIRTLKI